MKRLTPLALLAVFLFALSGQLAAQPKITLPDVVFDFGYVMQNAKISHTFWLYSTGTDSLKIEKVTPG
jgi:hypothetical protein